MSDDTTPDVPDEPDADLEDPQDAGQQDDDHTPDDDVTDEPDAAELKTRLTEAEAEAARYKRRLIASDTRKKQVERELRELRSQQPKNDTKTDDADTQTQRQPDDAVTRELEDLRRQVADQKVRTAFSAYTKYEWQNPNAAWRLLDLTDVRQDDGTVDEDDLHDAVDKLAKENAFLLKTPENPAPRGERPTGQQPGQHRRDQKPDRAAMASRFPALRGRI